MKNFETGAEGCTLTAAQSQRGVFVSPLFTSVTSEQILRRKQGQIGARPRLLKGPRADGKLGEQREVPVIPAPGNETRALLEEGYSLGLVEVVS